MSHRHDSFAVLFIGSGLEGTVCRYRQGISFEELRSVVCDAWGPARFNYEAADGLTLPVNNNMHFQQFLERLRRDQVESCVREDAIDGATYPVLRCLLECDPPTQEFGVVTRPETTQQQRERLMLKDRQLYQEQQEQVLLREQQEQQQLQQQQQASRPRVLRPVKPGAAASKYDSDAGYSDPEQQQESQLQQPYRPYRPASSSSTINRVRDESTSTAIEQPSSSNNKSSGDFNGRPQILTHANGAEKPSGPAASDPLESTQPGTSDEQQQQQQQQQQQREERQRVSFARGLSQESAAAAAAATSSQRAAQPKKQPSNEDVVVLVIRTQVPPVCAQVRVDQGGLIGNLRAHVMDVAKRNARSELPSNFMLSFTRPDCEQAIDVEDDSDFSFLKSSIKRYGAEDVCLYADVKAGGGNSGVHVNEAAMGHLGMGISSPLKRNPFAPTSRSPSRRNPLDDAANQLV